MADEPTCGRGLAEHSVVPRKLSDLLASLVENLETHLPTLDSDDPNAALERDAYTSLIAEFRTLGSGLRSVADEMAGYRDLPMARHVASALAAPEIMTAFRNLVQVEREVLDALGRAFEQDRQILEMFEGTS
jgi:hypothetical protein